MAFGFMQLLSFMAEGGELRSPLEGEYMDSDFMDATNEGGLLENNPELLEAALSMAAMAKELPSFEGEIGKDATES